jgi:hypothetical protein
MRAPAAPRGPRPSHLRVIIAVNGTMVWVKGGSRHSRSKSALRGGNGTPVSSGQRRGPSFPLSLASVCAEFPGILIGSGQVRGQSESCLKYHPRKHTGSRRILGGLGQDRGWTTLVTGPIRVSTDPNGGGWPRRACAGRGCGLCSCKRAAPAASRALKFPVPLTRCDIPPSRRRPAVRQRRRGVTVRRHCETRTPSDAVASLQ